MNQTEVLVVGAGPVGLTLAAELARRGVPSRIIDQSVGPSTTSKAIAIQPRTLEIFSHMGLVDEVMARGFVVGAGNFYLNGRPLARVDFHDLDSPYGFIVDLPQNETEEVLLEHLARNGLHVERETRLLRLEQDPEGVSADVAGRERSETLRCSYVVGCDGAYSTVRHTLGLKYESSPLPELLVLGDVMVDWLYPHEFHMFMHADGFLVCFPLQGGRYRLIAEVTAQELPLIPGAENPPKATPERFREIVRRRAQADADIGDVTWLAGFRIQHQVVEQYGQGRVFVAGDAAHVPSPAGGQGMNTGIQDACNLAWKIQLALRGHASTGLLDSYSAERAPVGRDMVALSDRLGHSAPDDVSTLVEQISEIGIHYRNSPIVGEDWRGDGGPQPGDRAPVIGLNGTAHHVLLFAGDRPDLEALQRISDLMPKGIVGPRLVTKRPLPWDDPLLLDEDGSIHSKYGATSSCMYLIRPDGYIGYRALPAQPDRIEAYLRKVFR
jgi:pentachlorophenol monooxygenase